MIPDTCNFIAGELCERSGLVSNDVISFCLSVPGWECTGRETRKWEAKWRKQGGGNTQQKTGNEVSTFFFNGEIIFFWPRETKKPPSLKRYCRDSAWDI